MYPYGNPDGPTAGGCDGAIGFRALFAGYRGGPLGDAAAGGFAFVGVDDNDGTVAGSEAGAGADDMVNNRNSILVPMPNEAKQSKAKQSKQTDGLIFVGLGLAVSAASLRVRLSVRCACPHESIQELICTVSLVSLVPSFCFGCRIVEISTSIESP